MLLGTAWRGVAEMRWARFAFRRSGRLLVSLWVMITATFLMIHLIPGDPIRASLGLDAPQALVEARRTALGLDQPLLIQYFAYFTKLLTGDWGVSLATGEPVFGILAARLPGTLQLALPAFVLVIAVAVPLGLAMAALTRAGRRRRTELAFTSSSIVLEAIPGFLLAVGLVYVFGVTLGWVPVAGRSEPSSYIVPVVALAAAPTAILARIMRIETLAVLQSDFIRTARAKRLGPARLYLRHALPNAATATLTVSGLLLGAMIAGTVLIENVVAWPGLGSVMVASIIAKNYPVVQGTVLIFGALILLINVVVDILLATLDPRSSILED